MKIFGQAVGEMYIWSIILLCALVAIASYSLNTFPTELIVAMLACGVFEVLLVKFYLSQTPRFPFSGVITGLIIGSVAPLKTPLLVVTAACAVAISSKFVIKIKSSNVFNPAALGLFIVLGMLSIGDSWWIATNYNILDISIPLTIILAISSYQARRLILSFAFIITLALISTFTNNVGFLTALMSINFFFAFLMLAEPKTSPSKPIAQAVYGISIAVLYVVLGLGSISYPFFVSLLLGNLAFVLYRYRGHKLFWALSLKTSDK